jgi:hypothetical protein
VSAIEDRFSCAGVRSRAEGSPPPGEVAESNLGIASADKLMAWTVCCFCS